MSPWPRRRSRGASRSRPEPAKRETGLAHPPASDRCPRGGCRARCGARRRKPAQRPRRRWRRRAGDHDRRRGRRRGAARRDPAERDGHREERCSGHARRVRRPAMPLLRGVVTADVPEAGDRLRPRRAPANRVPRPDVHRPRVRGRPPCSSRRRRAGEALERRRPDLHEPGRREQRLGDRGFPPFRGSRAFPAWMPTGCSRTPTPAR